MADDIRLPSTQQRALLDTLRDKGDVAIDDLFAVIDGPGERYRSSRQRQQWLGSYLIRLNRRLRKHKLKVQPGQMKRTYRLTVV